MSDLTVPANILLLHTGEETLREESLRRIAEAPHMAAHLEMIERCMDLIYALLPSTAVSDEDQLVLGNLGIRMFNTVAAALKLMLSGYYQASALQLRDVLETTFLLDYFSTDASLLIAWRTLPEAKRKNAFKPVTVRVALDARDGFTEKKRAKAYDLLSRLAGHATPEGAIMLVPDRNASYVHCGPFLEDTALLAVLSECAALAAQAAGAFRVLIVDENLDQAEARIIFMQAEADWFERFYEIKPDRAKIAEMRTLLAQARAEEGAATRAVCDHAGSYPACRR